MKKFLSLFLALVMILSLPACGGKEPPVEAEKPTVDMTPVVKDPPAVEPPVEEEVYEGPWNPLTGLPCETDLSNARPYAIMLNNLQKALPQYGVAKADIIYEVPAEGGITRMLGIFTDITDLGNVGSIRSARDYYVQIARGHDALYVHAGGSPGAYDLIANAGIDSIDGIKGAYNAIFWRDATRKAVAGYEHSLFLTASELKAYAEENPDFHAAHFAEEPFPLAEYEKYKEELASIQHLLSKSEWLLFEYIVIKGCDLRTTAKACHISYDYVRVRWFRIRRKIQKELGYLWKT